MMVPDVWWVNEASTLAAEVILWFDTQPITDTNTNLP